MAMKRIYQTCDGDGGDGGGDDCDCGDDGDDDDKATYQRQNKDSSDFIASNECIFV